MLNRVSLTEARRVTFRIIRPFATLACLCVLGVTLYAATLNGKMFDLKLFCQWGMARFSSDRTIVHFGFDPEVVRVPFDVDVVIAPFRGPYNRDTGAYAQSSLDRYWYSVQHVSPKSEVWYSGPFTLYLPGGRWYVAIEFWFASAALSSCLLILIAGRPLRRCLQRSH